MTLTELRYIVAVAREKHFGHAAEKCFVSQPTLSIAIKKLEEELGVALFERSATEVRVTDVGSRVIEQAQRVLEEASAIQQIAAAGKDELATPLRFGTIYTVGPYVTPQLIPLLKKRAPRMPLLIQENYTAKLGEMLKSGEVDVILLSDPFSEAGIVTQAIYDEPFRVVMPATHAWAKKARINAGDLCSEKLLLLSSGNCFRDQLLETCVNARSGKDGSSTNLQQSLEGSSLETIRQMVASGVGITALPSTAAESRTADTKLTVTRNFSSPEPSRRIVLAWRRSFPRMRAVQAVQQALLACKLPGVTLLPREKPIAH